MTAVDLTGRHVLVTGGSRGIGLAIAQALATAGAAVAIAARESAVVEGAVESLPGDRHIPLTLDVAVAAQWTTAMEQIDAWGELSGVVTAAGVLAPIGKIGDYDPAAFADTVAINLHGTFLALHHAIPRLQRTGGSAVTLSGGGATSPLPRFDAYAASKAAVVRLTENVADAVSEDGVRVNCVAPGMVATRMHDATLSAGPEAVGREYFERTERALEDGAVAPEVAAELVTFLLSEKARDITGRLLSAQWDDWRDPDFPARLAADPAFGTLRRVDGMFVTTTEKQ